MNVIKEVHLEIGNRKGSLPYEEDWQVKKSCCGNDCICTAQVWM